jgi:hypothetical protein
VDVIDADSAGESDDGAAAAPPTAHISWGAGRATTTMTRLLPVAPSPKQPLPPPQQHTQSLRGSILALRRTTPAFTQRGLATRSSCSSGVDDDRQYDGGGFEHAVVAVAAEAAVGRKEIRQMGPLLSELQVPEWQELALAVGGPAEVEKGVEEHPDY